MQKFLLVALCLAGYSMFAKSVENHFDMQKLNSDGKEIHYYLLKSDPNPSKELLVLIQGSDCKSVVNNQNMVKNFREVLPNSDVLLVEKTGLTPDVGLDDANASEENCPVEYMRNDSYFERVDNYIAVLNQLKNQYQHIILLGGSEGAIVTNIIASKVDFIDAAISLNGGGQFFINDVIYSIEKSVPTEEVQGSIDGFNQFANAVLHDHLDDDQFPSNHGQNWWYEALTVDNKKLLQGVRKPHLVIQTLTDINVDVEGSQKMMNEINNPNITYKTYSTLDHYFKDSQGDNQAAMVITDIQNWYTKLNIKK
ncbi:TPA: alpha/beta hydrolase [Providencia alcalifaciens]|nr:alpha/beta hydrolase [Providencia alcalifaciens]